MTAWHIIIKTTSTEKNKRILKALREKKSNENKGKPTKTTADFSTETLKSRRAWSEVFQALKENNFSFRILYPAKLQYKMNGGKTDFSKQNLTIYDYKTTTTEDILYTGDKRTRSINPHKKNRKVLRE
jgi:hypothetical protein